MVAVLSSSFLSICKQKCCGGKSVVVFKSAGPFCVFAPIKAPIDLSVVNAFRFQDLQQNRNKTINSQPTTSSMKQINKAWGKFKQTRLLAWFRRSKYGASGRSPRVAPNLQACRIRLRHKVRPISVMHKLVLTVINMGGNLPSLFGSRFQLQAASLRRCRHRSCRLPSWYRVWTFCYILCVIVIPLERYARHEFSRLFYIVVFRVRLLFFLFRRKVCCALLTIASHPFALVFILSFLFVP